MDRPWAWHPDVVDTQLLRIGELVVVGVPGEFTTMAGRRIREAVAAALKAHAGFGPEVKVVLAGLSNLYTQYIATKEEYAAQRYEAASTIYGPNTLAAYTHAFAGLAPFVSDAAIAANRTAPAGPPPADLLASHKMIEGLPAPGPDLVLPGRHLGEVLAEPAAAYALAPGLAGPTVNATFYGANPRQAGALRRGGSFLEVQQQRPGDGGWATVANDASLSTRLHWHKVELVPAAGPGSGSDASDAESDADAVPLHMRGPFGLVERLTGRQLSLPRLEACAAAGRACSLADASTPAGTAAGAAVEGLLYHSELTVSWRPAEDLIAGGRKLETGSYRIVYHGDAMGIDHGVASFNGTSRPFHLAVH
jgi:hypothetical protein